ncbi:MAG: hypothetical protein J4G05_07090 [Chlorobi bacterium]|nr:hypothetical protein [Chlorobiota bacterium]
MGAKIAQPFTAGTKKKLASGKIAQPFTAGGIVIASTLQPRRKPRGYP